MARHTTGVDAASDIRAAGGRIVVRGVEERVHHDPDRAGAVEAGRPQLLQRATGEQRARADRVEVLLGVAPARRVEAVDPAGGRRVGRVDVETGEQRDDGQTLHGHAEVAADHRGQPVGLAVKGQLGALDLLVVLELDLVEPDDLDRQPRHAGDADQRVVIGLEDLLDVALRDQVARGGAPVAGHDHTVGVDRRDDGRAVRDGGPVTHRAGQQLRGCGTDEVGERGRAGGVGVAQDAVRAAGRFETQDRSSLLGVRAGLPTLPRARQRLRPPRPRRGSRTGRAAGASRRRLPFEQALTAGSTVKRQAVG